MKFVQYRTARAVRIAVAAVLMVCLVLVSPALAAKKKKEDEAPPTKSYVMPYIIVLGLVSLGLMTICRPGSRKERTDEKKKGEA